MSDDIVRRPNFTLKAMLNNSPGLDRLRAYPGLRGARNGVR